MKFGKYLQIKMVPEWRGSYVSYRRLKRIIKRLPSRRSDTVSSSIDSSIGAVRSCAAHLERAHSESHLFCSDSQLSAICHPLPPLSCKRVGSHVPFAHVPFKCSQLQDGAFGGQVIDMTAYDPPMPDTIGYGVPLLGSPGVIRLSSDDKHIFDEVWLSESV